MSMGLAFWIIFLIHLIYYGVSAYRSKDATAWAPWALLPIVLIGLLGWRVFGPPIHG